MTTTQTLEVSTTALARQLTKGLELADCADWSIYVRTTGAVACQPHAGEHVGWYELVSMRDFADLADADGRCRGDAGFDAGGLAAWIAQEHQGYLPGAIDIDGDTVDVIYAA